MVSSDFEQVLEKAGLPCFVSLADYIQDHTFPNYHDRDMLLKVQMRGELELSFLE